ncbi:MAG: CRP-like cAMP-binding protein [Thermoproteota archaeon]
MIDDIKTVLSNMGELPEEEWQRLKGILNERKLKKDDYFIQAGEKSTEFAFIGTGLVRYFYTTFDGNEFNQTFKNDKDFILDYYPMLTGEVSPLSVQALEDTTIYSGCFEEFTHFYDIHPCWNKLGRKMAELNFLQKCSRERQLLLFDATGRYLNFIKEFASILDKIPQYHIALYLGVNPATLNRLIKKLGREEAAQKN